MLHATRPNHPAAPHDSMLGAQLVLALGAGKLLQARHRHGSTWASPGCCRAGRGVVLAAHGEGGHQVRAPSVRKLTSKFILLYHFITQCLLNC